MQQQGWVDYLVQTRWTDNLVTVRTRHTFLEVFDGDARRTSTETLHRSRSEPRSIGRSIVNHEPMSESPGQVLSSEHEISVPESEPEAVARLLVRWPAMQAAEVDEVSSHSEVSDSDVGSPDTYTSDMSVSSGMLLTGKQRKSRLRPCKGQRLRYRKLVTRLVEQHKNTPDRFDIASVRLPPSISTPNRVAKLDKKVQGRLNQERGRQLEDSESASISVAQVSFARASDAGSSSDVLPMSFAMVPCSQLAHARGTVSHGSDAPTGEREVMRTAARATGMCHPTVACGSPAGPHMVNRRTIREEKIEGQTQGRASFQDAQQHAGPRMQQSVGENVPLESRAGMVISLSNILSRDGSTAPNGYDMEGGSSHRPPISRRHLQPAGHAAPSSFQALAATKGYGAQDGFGRDSVFSRRHQPLPARDDQFTQSDGWSSSTMFRLHLQPSGGYNLQGDILSLANQSQHTCSSRRPHAQ